MNIAVERISTGLGDAADDAAERSAVFSRDVGHSIIFHVAFRDENRIGIECTQHRVDPLFHQIPGLYTIHVIRIHVAKERGENVEVLADLFKTSKNPVAYLGGMAISSVDMAVQEGIKADWSEEGRLMVFDEIVKNPGVIVEEFGDAVGEVFGQKIWSIF